MKAVTAVLLALVVAGGCAIGGPAASPSAPASPARTPVADPPPTSPPPAATPSATPSPLGSPSASPPPASPSSSPSVDPSAAFSINLYHDGDWISQQTKYYCLPAAMQVMINIISDGPHDPTQATQDRLHELARSLSSGRQRGKGSEPIGWAEGLNNEGFGPYIVDDRPTIEEAIRLAARQLRLTNRPVGLLAWRGAHAWVMSGFESLGDPALTDDFTVTALWIQDVWYPRISSNWGDAYPPNSLVAIEALPEDFRPYRRPRVEYPEHDGQYVMVLPVDE